MIREPGAPRRESLEIRKVGQVGHPQKTRVIYVVQVTCKQ